MARTRVTVDSSQLQRLMKELQARTGALQLWFRGPLDKSVSSMLRRHFDSKGEFGGTRWAQLKPSTVRGRLRRGGNRGGVSHPLWDFGRLRGSLLNPAHPEALRVITRNSYERGTVVPYARFHQHGTNRMPARPVIPDPPDFIVGSWERSLALWIERGSL